MGAASRAKKAGLNRPTPEALSALPRNLEITTLDNGLTVVTDRMDHLESAALGVWVKAGSRDERADQHGIAHVLEHMAFKGTNSRTARDIATQIENVGGDVNAATSVETTSYYARVLRNDVGLAVDILSDILTDSLFDAEELRREQHVILQEIGAAQDSPEDVVFDQFQATAFSDQALGRPIMGTPETVSSFDSSHIRDYLSDHYHGPNMVLSASGAVDHDEIVKLAESRMGTFSATPPSDPEPAHYTGGDYREPKPLMEAQILLGFEGRAYHVRDFYASQVLAMLMGGGMSSRLFQEVREKRGLCYSIYAFHWGYRDTGTFGIHAATGEEDVSQLIEVLIEELRTASSNITQNALDRARAQISAGLLMSQESPAARAGQIARQMLLFGRPVGNEELMERINALTVERLSDLADRLFTQTEPTVAAVGPIGNLPSRDDITANLRR